MIRPLQPRLAGPARPSPAVRRRRPTEPGHGLALGLAVTLVFPAIVLAQPVTPEATPSAAQAGGESAAEAGSESTAQAATEEEVEAARGWFAEGIGAVEREQWERAAELFQRVLRVKSSAVVAYNLASALAHLGRVRESADLLRPIARDPEATAEARASAAELLREVETRIGAVTVRATGNTDGITVVVREQILPGSALGRPIEVDPGTVEIAIQRDDEVIATASVKVGDGAPLQTEVVMALPEPVAIPAPAPVPTPAQTARSARPLGPTPTPLEPQDEDDSLLSSPWFWTGVAVVVAGGIATGVALGLQGEPEPADPTRGNLDPPFIRGSVSALSE